MKKNNSKNKIKKTPKIPKRSIKGKKTKSKKTPTKSNKSKGPKLKETKKKLAGKVTHYFNKIKVAVVKPAAPISLGNKIEFLGNKSNFSQKISSLQVNHVFVKKCKKGKLVGLKVQKRVRVGDLVYFAE
jgi:hypothetical protein